MMAKTKTKTELKDEIRNLKTDKSDLIDQFSALTDEVQPLKDKIEELELAVEEERDKSLRTVEVEKKVPCDYTEIKSRLFQMRPYMSNRGKQLMKDLLTFIEKQ